MLLFVLGFQNYRKSRLMEDTPFAPIRSIPMGLVHVHGKATGDDRLSSPLTRAPCYHYEVLVQKWVQQKRSWEAVQMDSEERNFYLDDGTGKVLVNPHSAQYDVALTYEGGFGPQSSGKTFFDLSLGVQAPTEHDLRAYLTELPQKTAARLRASGPAGNLLAGAFGAIQALDSGSQGYRFTEKCLIANRDQTLLGTCAENPNPKDEHDRNIILRGHNERILIISSKSEIAEEKRFKRNALIMVGLGIVLMVAGAAFLVF